jgi:hypothetical protein
MVSVLLVLLATAAFAATTVRGSKSNSSFKIAGLFVTSSATLSGPSDTQPVYTTPATGSVYLTQFCASDVAGGVRLDVAGLGSIALAGTPLSCIPFDSKVLLPPNATVTCSTGSAAPAGSYFCTVMGIESSK